jgi:aminoglycoside phosphotransferase (APT) family kinase protein
MYADYDLAPQALVQNAVAAAGVPAPSPAVVVTDPGWIGTPFLAMPRVGGTIPGPAPLFDPWVREAGAASQRKLHDGLIDTLAAVHRVDWRAHGLGQVLPGPTLGDALARWAAYVQWAGGDEPLPVLLEGLDWCRRHQPEPFPGGESKPVLLWGDPRLGNLVFDAEYDVHAVLDWDLASIGPREMDLGWYFGLDAMMETLFGGRVAGFPPRDDAVARYERRSGHRVADLEWHEVFALVRALAIHDRHRQLTGGHRSGDDPMAAVLRSRMESIRSDGAPQG